MSKALANALRMEDEYEQAAPARTAIATAQAANAARQAD